MMKPFSQLSAKEQGLPAGAGTRGVKSDTPFIRPISQEVRLDGYCDHPGPRTPAWSDADAIAAAERRRELAGPDEDGVT